MDSEGGQEFADAVNEPRGRNGLKREQKTAQQSQM